MEVLREDVVTNKKDVSHSRYHSQMHDQTAMLEGQLWHTQWDGRPAAQAQLVWDHRVSVLLSVTGDAP